MNPAISKLESQSSKTLLSLLDDMFGSCDDMFFDLASRAESNLEQNLYFESMREVRVRADHCRAQFKKNLSSNFVALGKNQNDSGADDPGLEEMSLVQHDDMELEVAVKSMTTRARVATKHPLYEFHARIESLFPGHIEEDQNPLDPGSLIALFVEAARDIEIDIKAKIILLKQYERFVINRLGEIYVNANKLLEDLGVRFIDERHRHAKNAARAGARGAAATAGEAQGLLDENLEQHYLYSSPALSELSSLLGRLRASPKSAQGLQFARAPLFHAEGGSPISSDELVQMLQSAGSTASSDPESFDLRNFVRQLLRREEKTNKKVSVEQVDEDIINLVAMFFDFVLDDHNIPDVVKALISRLQMPVLKIALKDKTFFTNTEHGCRQFINEISRVSIGLDQSGEDSNELLEKIEQWIHDIQNEPAHTEQAFSDALQELQEYSSSLEKRAELVEKRTSEGAQGQARKQIAKMKAQKAIQEAMDSKVVAKPVADFIVQTWQQVLYRSYLKDGDESPSWLGNLQSMQDLIWCSQPHEDEKSRARLDRIKAGLLESIREGLKESTLNTAQSEKLVEQLDETIDVVAGRSKDQAKQVDLKPFRADKQKELETLAEQKSWREMTALERQQKQHQALTYEFIERADSVPVGSWLEFKVPASGTIIRCKLAAKLEGSDTYVFVNRLGFKALEKPRKEFAFDLQRKRARLLKSGPLFDRSLHKMVSTLKSAK